MPFLEQFIMEIYNFALIFNKSKSNLLLYFYLILITQLFKHEKILFILVILITFSSYSQEQTNRIEKKNEVYLNAFNLIAFKWVDVSYERIINEESSAGISLLAKIGDEWSGYDSERNYSITPYYRHYFSNKYARGFFMEAFTMLNGGVNEYYWDNYSEITDEYTWGSEEREYNDVAFGVGVGGKFISKRGFIGEIHAGIGRNLFDANAPDVIGRGSVSFGFRF